MLSKVMYKISLVCLLLFGLTNGLFAREEPPVVITTEKVALVYNLNSENELVQTYFGKKLNFEDEYSHIDPSNKKALVTAGTQDRFEPVMGVKHVDGNLSLKLEFIDFTQAYKEDKNIEETKIELRDPNYPFFINLYFKAYQKENIIEQRAEIVHNEEGAVTLTNFASSFPQLKAEKYFLTHFYGDWANEMRMEESELMEGKYVIESKIGARTTRYKIPSFMVSLNEEAQEEQGEVVAGTLAWSGNFSISFENIKESDNGIDLLQIVAGMNNYRSHYVLEPNKPLLTPNFVFTYSDKGKGQASRNIHHWAINYGVYGGRKSKSTLLNNWEATYFDFDENKITSLIGNAAELGVDVFLLDDGWFGNEFPRNNDDAGLGDWEVNRKKLPNGLSKLVDESVKKDVVFGIWVEPEMVNPESELYHKHPEWILKQPEREEDLQRNQLVLDLANPEVQEHVFDVVNDILEENPKIGYIKWDCNRYMTNVYSSYLDDKQSNLYIDYTEGLYKVLDKIRKKYPDLELMWCSGGGGRAEYGGLAYTNEFWPSDNTDPLQRIYMHYGYSYFFPMGTQASHVTSFGDQPLKFKLDVAMSAKLGFDIRVDELSKNEKRLAQTVVGNYKKFHELINLGDLYRLIPPYENNHASWMNVSAEKDKAILFLYNLNTLVGDQFESLSLQGLDPNKKYKLMEINVLRESDVKFPKNNAIFSGDYLMKVGIPWFLEGSTKSAVIDIEEVKDKD